MTDCKAKPKAMWWVWLTTVTALYAIRQRPYFFGISGPVNRILPLWILKGGPINHQGWAFSRSPALFGQHGRTTRKIYTAQQRGWTLSWTVFTQRGYAEDCDRPNNVVFARRCDTNTEPTSHGSFTQPSLTADTAFSQRTSAIREGRRWVSLFCNGGILALLNFRAA